MDYEEIQNKAKELFGNDFSKIYPKEGNEIIDLMQKSGKNQVIEIITELKNGYLEEIVATILNEYDVDENMKPEFDYLFLEDILDDKCVQGVFKKFHPNFKKELCEFEEYLNHLELSDSLVKVNILDVALAEKRVSVLMGDAVEPRKNWINENVVFSLEDSYQI